jgi:hypothetical protein
LDSTYYTTYLWTLRALSMVVVVVSVAIISVKLAFGNDVLPSPVTDVLVPFGALSVSGLWILEAMVIFSGIDAPSWNLRKEIWTFVLSNVAFVIVLIAIFM